MITREQIIAHILRMKQDDEAYSYWALLQYRDWLPEMKLMAGVTEAMEKQIQEKQIG